MISPLQANLFIFEIFEHHIISDNLKNLLLELWQISISLFVNATKDNCTEETALKEDLYHGDKTL
jgi:hypothetical protein